MSKVSELEGKIKWNEDEIRIRRRKLEDARQAVGTAESDVREIEQKLEQRKRELSDAKRDEQREKEKTKSSDSKRY